MLLPKALDQGIRAASRARRTAAGIIAIARLTCAAKKK
jgi:hypothetical protein